MHTYLPNRPFFHICSSVKIVCTGPKRYGSTGPTTVDDMGLWDPSLAPSQKEAGSSSNHPFLGANCLLVSGRVHLFVLHGFLEAERLATRLQRNRLFVFSRFGGLCHGNEIDAICQQVGSRKNAAFQNFVSEFFWYCSGARGPPSTVFFFLM